MKKLFLVIMTIIGMFFITACFKTRTELFTLSIQEDTYMLNENLEPFIKIEDNIITYASISFKNLDREVLMDNEYDINTFGDFSFKEIKLFEIIFYLGFNYNEASKYDLLFKGQANPGRSNAYRFESKIEEINQGNNNLIVVIEFNTNIGRANNTIGNINIQIKNPYVSGIGESILLRNEIENQRAESLKLVNEIFLEFKREDYEQDNWNKIFDIHIKTRNALNQAIDIESITLLTNQCLNDLSKVPKITN